MLSGGTLVLMFHNRASSAWPKTEPSTKWASHGVDIEREAKLSPEGEAIAAYGTATMVAFKVLVACLQRNGALRRGEYAEALRVFTEGAESEVDSMPLAILHNLRIAMQD